MIKNKQIFIFRGSEDKNIITDIFLLVNPSKQLFFDCKSHFSAPHFTWALEARAKKKGIFSAENGPKSKLPSQAKK